MMSDANRNDLLTSINFASNYRLQGNFNAPVTTNLVLLMLHIPLRQLRAPVGDFAGRHIEIDQLVQALRRAADNRAIAAISGICRTGGGETKFVYTKAIVWSMSLLTLRACCTCAASATRSGAM